MQQNEFIIDETGCSTDPTGKKMFFKKSSKENYLMTPNCGKAMYTILVACQQQGNTCHLNFYSKENICMNSGRL